jgi:glycosyltransferase involved in cell wall biosynthesis
MVASAPPVISIGLPFYNNRAALAGAIRSIFAQTCHRWELILVDDGSSDGSLEIAQAVKDPRVRVIVDGGNKGLSARLNEIAAGARGRFVARMDADDLMHPRRIEKQLALLEANPGVDIAGTATYVTDAQWQPRSWRANGPLDTTLASVLRRGLFIHPTVTARVAWARANPYSVDHSRAQDLELWCRTCSFTRGALVPEPLHFYREPAPINVATYLETSRSVRRIARSFAPAALGRRRALALLLRQQLAAVAYRVSRPLGLDSWLLERRSSPLTASERDHARAVVQAILETRVPGLDTVPCGEAR